MKILYRYVSFEIFRFFLLSLFLFIFVILMDRASDLAETILGNGVSTEEFISVLVKAIPSFLGVTIPMAFVIAVVITFAQMNANNELVALRACGINLARISTPVFVLGSIFSAASFFSLMFLAPRSNIAMKKEMEELLKKRVTMSITPRSFCSNFPEVVFYTDKIYPKRGFLENFMVTLKKRDEFITIFARRGILRTEGNEVFLDVENGTGQFLKWRDIEKFKFINFKNYTVKLYTFSEKEHFSAVKYKDMLELFSMKGNEPKVELIKRAGLALAPLIVGILAFSVVVSLPRGSVGTGVILGLSMIVSYYVIYTFSKKIALTTGLLPLPLLPDAIFLALAIRFYRRVAKESGIFLAGGRW